MTQQGQARTFEVCVKPRCGPGVKYPPLEGPEALRLMERFHERGLTEVAAYTESPWAEETITLESMRKLYPAQE